jgi:hypothetical protein
MSAQFPVDIVRHDTATLPNEALYVMIFSRSQK